MLLTALDDTVFVAAPKVLLHDHLDGGLRPETVIELAGEIGHELPSTDPAGLAAWFVESAVSGSLERYLETFVHTVAVMQTADSLVRVARECVEDLAADIPIGMERHRLQNGFGKPNMRTTVVEGGRCRGIAGGGVHAGEVEVLEA